MHVNLGTSINEFLIHVFNLILSQFIIKDLNTCFTWFTGDCY